MPLRILESCINLPSTYNVIDIVLIIEYRTVNTTDKTPYFHFYGGRKMISKSMTCIVDDL